MGLNDQLEILATDVDVTSTGDIGSDLNVQPTGDGAGLRYGAVYEAELTILEEVTGTSPTLQAYILGVCADTSEFFLGVFPLISDSSPFPIESIDNGAGSVKAYFKIPQINALSGQEVVAIGGYGVVGGSNSPTFPNVNIHIRPALVAGSVS